MVHWFMPVHLLSLPNWRDSGLVVVEHLTPFNFAATNPKNFFSVVAVDLRITKVGAVCFFPTCFFISNYFNLFVI
ncbi:MAG: hypothetical protein RL296_796 [Actinomycetota bacterium]